MMKEFMDGLMIAMVNKLITEEEGRMCIRAYMQKNYGLKYTQWDKREVEDVTTLNGYDEAMYVMGEVKNKKGDIK